jgi:hypothetical protein
MTRSFEKEQTHAANQQRQIFMLEKAIRRLIHIVVQALSLTTATKKAKII